MLFLLAWRNIWRNKVRSLVIMTSVAIGLFAGITVLAIYDGMMKWRVKTVIEREVGHIQLHHPQFRKDYEAAYTLPRRQDLVQTLQQMPAVKYTAPRSIVQGMLTTATGSAGVQINGVDDESEKHVSHLDQKIVEGKTFKAGKQQMVLGKKLLDKLKLKLHSKVVLTFVDKDNNLISSAFRIAGVYQTENTPLDEKNVYVSIQDLNGLLNIGAECHELAILLHSNNDIGAVMNDLKKRYPGVVVESWQAIAPEVDLMISSLDQYSFIIVIIIMVALAFGIVNTMLMAILERIKEIGMMIALGMTRLRVFVLVFLETVLLTLLGCPVGFFLAWAFTSLFAKRGIDISSFAGKAMSGFGFGSIIYPEFPYDKIFPVFMIVVITALVSCLFPALKAVRVQTVAALNQ